MDDPDRYRQFAESMFEKVSGGPDDQLAFTDRMRVQWPISDWDTTTAPLIYLRARTQAREQPVLRLDSGH